MKKIFALVLSIIMVMSLATTTFAVEYVGNSALDATDSNTSFQMYGKITEDIKTVSVIAADVSYGAMRFVYVTAGGQIWNPETHKYDAADTDLEYGQSWTAENESNLVTVTNHSNVAIDVKLDAATTITYKNDGLDIVPVEVKITNETDAGVAVGTNTIDYCTVAAAEENSALDSQQITWSLMLSCDNPAPGGNHTIQNFGTDITDEFKPVGSVTVSIKEAE